MRNMADVLIEAGNTYPSPAPKFTSGLFLVGSVLLIFLFFVLSYYVSLRSEFRVVMSVTISAKKRCSVRLYLQLFVVGFMSCLRSLYLFAHSGVQHILSWVFFVGFFSSCVPYFASFFELPIFDVL